MVKTNAKVGSDSRLRMRRLLAPPIVVLLLAAAVAHGGAENLIFADGFEGGNFAQWSLCRGCGAVDVVFVIDNSASMAEEIAAFVQSINGFAAQLDADDVDFRVILVTAYGAGSLDVCVPPPLSQIVNCSAPPVNNPGRFYHYANDVQSRDAPCEALRTLPEEVLDEYAQAGWSQWLRPGARKHLVWITDDRPDCIFDGTALDDEDTTEGGMSVADAIDTELTGSYPDFFGTVQHRVYRSHAVIGVAVNPFDENAPYPASDPEVSLACPAGVNTGKGYQWLSKGTGGLRMPSCSIDSYDTWLEALAEAIRSDLGLP